MGESYTGVPALERAAQVLEQVLHAPAGLAAKELYRSCGFPKASFYRLLQAMEQNGYLQQDPQSGRYFAGRLSGMPTAAGTSSCSSCGRPLSRAWSAWHSTAGKQPS